MFVSLTARFADMITDRPVILRIDGEIVASAGPYPRAVDGRRWLLVDYRAGGAGVDHFSESPTAAAWRLWEVLGVGAARRAVAPLVAAEDHARLFPLGSSLGWPAVPQCSYSGV